MIVDGAAGRLLDINVIHQIDEAPFGSQVKHHLPGTNADHQSAELHLVQGFMPLPHAENHLGIQFSRTLQRNHTGLYPKCCGNAAKACQLTFLIADIPAAVPKGHSPLCHQLNGLSFLLLIGLPALNGQHHLLCHLDASIAR